MVCRVCEEKGVKRSYLGETGREVKVRCKEHMYKGGKNENVLDVYCHAKVNTVELIWMTGGGGSLKGIGRVRLI